MGLADILAAIEAGAAEELAAIVAETDAAVADILADATRAAAAAHHRNATAGDAATGRRADHIVNAARLDADRSRRSAVEQVYDDLRVRVGERLSGIRDDPVYPILLGQLVDECRAVLPEAAVLAVDEADVEQARHILAEIGWDGCRVEGAIATVGGAVAQAGDGRSVVNTLETRLERADPHLRRLAAELIPALGSPA